MPMPMPLPLGRDSIAALKSSPMLEKLYSAREESPNTLHDIAVEAALNTSTRKELVESAKNLPHACAFCVIDYHHFEVAKMISDALLIKPPEEIDAQGDHSELATDIPLEILKDSAEISEIKKESTEILEIKSPEYDIPSGVELEKTEVAEPVVKSEEKIETSGEKDYEYFEESEIIIPEVQEHLVAAAKPHEMGEETEKKDKQHIVLVENLMVLHAMILEIVKSLSEEQLKHYIEGVFTHQRTLKLEPEQIEALRQDLKDKLDVLKVAFENGAEDFDLQVKEIMRLKRMLNGKGAGEMDVAFKDISARLDECLEELKTIKQSLGKRNEEFSKAKDLLLSKGEKCCDAPADELHLHGHLNGISITLTFFTEEERYKAVEEIVAEKKKSAVEVIKTPEYDEMFESPYTPSPGVLPPEYYTERMSQEIPEVTDEVLLPDTVDDLRPEVKQKDDKHTEVKEPSEKITAVLTETPQEVIKVQVEELGEGEIHERSSKERTDLEIAEPLSVEQPTKEMKPIDKGEKLPIEEIKISPEDDVDKGIAISEVTDIRVPSGTSSVGIPYYPSQSSLPPVIIELIHDSLEARKSIDVIEKRLSDLEWELLIRSSPAAPCARASVINEVQDPLLPYSPSLKSLPLRPEDFDEIQKRAEKYSDLAQNSNNQQPPAEGETEETANSSKLPWVVPDYTVEYVTAVRHNKSCESSQTGLLQQTRNDFGKIPKKRLNGKYFNMTRKVNKEGFMKKYCDYDCQTSNVISSNSALLTLLQNDNAHLNMTQHVNSPDSSFILDASQKYSDCNDCTSVVSSCDTNLTSLSEKSTCSQDTKDSSDSYELIAESADFIQIIRDDSKTHNSRKNREDQQGSSAQKKIKYKGKTHKNLECSSLIKECNVKNVPKAQIYENSFSGTDGEFRTCNLCVTKEAQHKKNSNLQEPKIPLRTENIIPSTLLQEDDNSNRSWALIRLRTLKDGTKTFELLETSDNPPGDIYLSESSSEL